MSAEIQTSTVGTKDEAKGRLVRKAKVPYSATQIYIESDPRCCVCNMFLSFMQIEILLGKTENFNHLVSTNKVVRQATEAEE